MRPLSRSAHSWAMARVIDVVENLCRQETKLPAVPPHYDIISEGWPTAAVYPITQVAPLACPEESSVPQWTLTHIRTHAGATKNHIHIHSMTETSHTHMYVHKSTSYQ